MNVLGCLNESIVTDIKSIAHVLEILRHLIGQCTRSGLQLAGLLQHLEAMDVRPGLEAHVAAAEPLETCDDVGRDRLIGMADMRAAIGIADRGGDVIGFAHGVFVCRSFG